MLLTFCEATLTALAENVSEVEYTPEECFGFDNGTITSYSGEYTEIK